MTLQRTPGAFRTAPLHGNINIYDVPLLGVAYQSVRTPGATLIDTVPISPGGSQTWKLQSLSIQGYLGLAQPPGGSPPFGALGRIVAGMLPPAQNPQPTGGAGVSFSQTMLPFPNDVTLMVNLWDPLVNPTPPAVTSAFTGTENVTALLPVSAIIAPNNLAALIGGQQLGVGIWMTPSIIGVSNTDLASYGLQLEYASYTLAYDDGL